MKASTLHTTIIELDDGETITIDELSIGEYKNTLFGLVREYGIKGTMNDMANRIVTVEVSDILCRMNYHYIRNWTLKDSDGNVMELTYANYINLPYRIESLIADAIEEWNE